ncbi:unnamed protein product [Arabidopsis halleri]
MTRVGVPLLVFFLSVISVSAGREGPDDVIKLPSQADTSEFYQLFRLKFNQLFATV